MFVLKVKSGTIRKAVVALVAAVSVCAAGIIIAMNSGRNAVADTATCDELGEYSLKAETEAERLSFLNSLGLKSDGTPPKRDTVIIPAEFNSVYNQYNALQKHSGLNLERFKGEPAERYRYPLEDSRSEYAVLLIKDGRVIGGHTTSGEYKSPDMPLI